MDERPPQFCLCTKLCYGYQIKRVVLLGNKRNSENSRSVEHEFVQFELVVKFY